MNAIICPVCCGRGTIPSQPVGVDLAEEKCHGCGGLGWVSVSDSPAELIENGPVVSRGFVVNSARAMGVAPDALHMCLEEAGGDSEGGMMSDKVTKENMRTYFECINSAHRDCDHCKKNYTKCIEVAGRIESLIEDSDMAKEK